MAVRNFSSTAAQTTLSAGVTAASTTLTVAATTGFPPPPFILAVNAGASAQELVLVTAVAGNNLTVTRGYDSTVVSAHDAGAVVQHSHAALDFREANTHVNATSAVHGVAGSLVGTTDTQTLTNKTVNADNNTINGFAASSFLVSDATGKADGSALQKAIPAGAVVGTTDTQVLTNKDLTSTTNSFPTANPRGVLGYAQVTTNQGSITTAVDLTGLTVGVTVGTGRRVRITALTTFYSSVAGDVASLNVLEGGTQLHAAPTYLALAGTGQIVSLSVVLTPTAGAHTYKLTANRAVGTGAVTSQASATGPAFIIVEDIGAV